MSLSGFDVLDEVLSASLTEDEIKELLRDPHTPADLFVRLSRAWIANKSEALGHPIWNHFVIDLYQDPRSRETSESFLLFASHLLRTIFHPMLVDPLPTRFLRGARPSQEDFAWFTDTCLLFVEPIRYACAPLIAHMASGRAARDGSENPTVAAALQALEAIFTAPDGVTDPQPGFAQPGAYLEKLAECLGILSTARLYPKRLIDHALSFGSHLPWDSMGQASFASSPDQIQGDRLDRILAVNSRFLDYVLVRNPELPQDALWRLYVRTLRTQRRGLNRAAAMFAPSPEVVQLVLDTRWGSMAMSLVTVHDSIPKHLRPDVCRLALDYILQGNRPSTHHVDILYQDLGDEAGVALASLQDRDIVGSLVHVGVARSDNLTLRAILTSSNSSCRGMLLIEPQLLSSLRPEHKVTLRNVILPVLVRDRSESVRDRANHLLLLLAETEEELHTVIAFGSSSDCCEIASLPRLGGELFDALIKRAERLSNDGGSEVILHTLAGRSDLSLEQYETLVTHGTVWVISRIACSVPDHLPGAYEFLFSLRSVHPDVTAQLAIRPSWNSECRKFFRTHPEAEIRQAFAHHCRTLDARDVLALMRDPSAAVRSALMRNTALPEMADALEARLPA